MEKTFLEEKLDNFIDWSYGGVNHSIPGNGGLECRNFLSLKWRIYESIVGVCISLLYVKWGYNNLKRFSSLPFIRKDRGGKRLLLVMVSLMFGIEIGFKFSTRQLIYLLNPCHITIALQIYLLAAPPSRIVTTIFRIHLNFLNGAILAILFPVTNARFLPFEYEVYWIEHLMMLVTPYYLLRLGGVYTIEEFTDMSWTVMSLGFLLLYHIVPLQVIGFLTEVNLNNMLCPAISDPFYGPYYRFAAVCHQSLCVPIVSKTFCLISDFFITKFGPTKIKSTLSENVTVTAFKNSGSFWDDYFDAKSNMNGNNHMNNGHIHRRSRSECFN